jgi:Fungal protein kinase
LKHNQDPQNLIKLFAAFAFADQTSLGFDPTIEKHEDGKQFIFSVRPTIEKCEDDKKQKQPITSVHPNNKPQPRRFLTIKLINSYGAEPFRGRGTRVFKAIEIEQDGSEKGLPVVLKDIWVDNDLAREGAILAQLHSEADSEDKQLVKKHFLNTECHGDVWTDDATLDDTYNALMRKLDLTTRKTFQLQKESLRRHQPATGSEGLRAVSRIQAPQTHPRYAHKTHYRIVFKEEGITIDRITTLPQVMTVLNEIVSGASLYDMTYPWARTLLLCSFTAVAKVGVGAP